MKRLRLILLAAAAFGLICSMRADDTWMTDYAAAKKVAADSGKKILMDFTGSDWCIYCKKLDAEVFTTAEFKDFSKDYVLLRVDFPRHKDQSDAEKKQNAALSDKFNIDGYPTVIVADATGAEIKRASGYDPGSGPGAFLAQFKAPSS
jgi:protein disulfide-isomerase